VQQAGRARRYNIKREGAERGGSGGKEGFGGGWRGAAEGRGPSNRQPGGVAARGLEGLGYQMRWAVSSTASNAFAGENGARPTARPARPAHEYLNAGVCGAAKNKTRGDRRRPGYRDWRASVRKRGSPPR
jgi:hypothetical protein